MNEDKVREALKVAEDFIMTSIKHDEIISLLRESLAPEPRFYKNQPVLVKDKNESKWASDVLLKLKDDLYEFEGIKCCWEECKPDPDAESIINWHLAEADPAPAQINSDKHLFAGTPDGKYWCLIPLPEFLS